MHSRVGQSRTIFSAKSCDALNVAKLSHLCHKPGLRRPADQGLPWRRPWRPISFRK